jgi:hypothetical protein
MTYWNPGLFLVIKRWWARLLVIVFGILAAWEFLELLILLKANLRRMEKVCRVFLKGCATRLGFQPN